MSGSEVVIDYTNWRGERRQRRIVPVRIVFEANEYHPQPQWLLLAADLEIIGYPRKTFALKNIHSWNEVAP